MKAGMLVMLVLCMACSPDLGQFEGATDIGDITIPGNFDYGGSTYTVRGSGSDPLGNEDGFHYVWKQVSGDVSIAADIDKAAKSESLQNSLAVRVRSTFHRGRLIVGKWPLSVTGFQMIRDFLLRKKKKQ